MGEVIGACFRAWDELERARNERRRLAVTLDGEKHFRSFVRRAFIVPNMHARRWEWCRRSGVVGVVKCVYVLRRTIHLRHPRFTCAGNCSSGLTGIVSLVSKYTNLQTR